MAAPPQSGPDEALPILWSFRRCPYAIRARLGLAAAGIAVEVREVNLAARPPEFEELGPPARCRCCSRLRGRPCAKAWR